MPGKVAIIDIGSYTIRLVVYDTPLRLPIPMFNEQSRCECWPAPESYIQKARSGLIRACPDSLT